jgi:hypothetical protein
MISTAPASGGLSENNALSSNKSLRLVVSRKHLGDGWIYRARLVNSGATAVTLDARQNPGGYVGNGRFFLCSVQRWQPAARKWTKAFDNVPADLVNANSTLPPGKELEVCAIPLPNLGVKFSELVRLKVRIRSSDSEQDGVVSAPFKVVKP